MMCGLPGAGKTTKAKEIELEHSALRLTPDEWITQFHGAYLGRSKRDEVRDRVEALQWQVAKRLLKLGCNVILDWGFWSKEERARYKREAESLGAGVKIVFLDAELDELWSRISQRPESKEGALHITKEDLKEWSEMFEAPTKEELSE